MSHRWKSIIACSSILVLAAIGCNRAGDGQNSANTASPSAAIGGDAQATPKPEESKTPAVATPTSDPRYPEVLIETSLGNIAIRLDRDKTPGTVDNFLSYVTSEFYDRTIVHQVYKGQGILAGGYGENYVEKPARPAIRNEADKGPKNLRGTIAMVRQPDNMDSAASQFFINVVDNPSLDYQDRTSEGYGYCVFGKVTEGMDIVDRINNAALQDTSTFERTPVEPIVVKSIRRLR